MAELTRATVNGIKATVLTKLLNFDDFQSSSAKKRPSPFAASIYSAVKCSVCTKSFKKNLFVSNVM